MIETDIVSLGYWGDVPYIFKLSLDSFHKDVIWLMQYLLWCMLGTDFPPDHYKQLQKSN